MILFIEDNIRGMNKATTPTHDLRYFTFLLIGGSSFINQRYSKAGKHTNDEGETFFNEILYIDGTVNYQF